VQEARGGERRLIAWIGRVLSSVLLGAIAAGAAGSVESRCADPPRPPRLLLVRVVRVIDGDSLHVRLPSGAIERVRLIGIDAPEQEESAKLARDAAGSGLPSAVIQALGRQATEFARTHLANQVVGLSLDVQTRDRYGRLLAYVWLGEGVLFNRLIVAEGYAQVVTIPPNVRYADVLVACEREAREQRRGFWR
jgi:micrococcal nuclease